MSLTRDEDAGPDLLLEARNLGVELGGLPVLRGVDLTLAAGETLALLGGNGSGKSTLVRTLLGLTPHQHGSVRLFGTELRRFRAWSSIGYVPQRSTVGLAGATVREVVGSGRLGRRRPFQPAGRNDRQAVRRALEAVDLADRAELELNRLSGGQQQRALIARALVGEPAVLLLDEPTAGVDLDHQHVLTEVLSRQVESGLGVLIVLHEVGPLAPLVQRAITLRDGRVIYDGPLPTELGGPHGGTVHEHEPPARPGLLAEPFSAGRAQRRSEIR